MSFISDFNKTKKELPNLLIVAGTAFSSEGLGADKALFNLFDLYPNEKLCLFIPRTSRLKSQPTSPPFNKRAITFPKSYFPYLYNRFGKFINPLLNQINHQLLSWLPINDLSKIQSFSPEIILICPHVPWDLAMEQKVTEYFKCPFIVYFMDDWVLDKDKNLHWLTGNVQLCTHDILKRAKAWLMISNQLKEALSTRYQLSPPKTMIINTAIDLSNIEAPDFKVDYKGIFKIIYSGSIWPMHYDAIEAVAKAVFQLQNQGNKIELTIQTKKEHWEYYKHKLYILKVNFQESVLYQELNKSLKQANLLLVASSFLIEQESYTRSSIQSKIFQYMATGKPILSCGPEYSVCNKFISQWNCGLTCTTNETEKIKSLLLNLMKDRETIQRYAITAYQILKDNFEKTKLCTELYNFILSVKESSD